MSQVGGSGTRSYAYNADNEILWLSDSTTALINVIGTVSAGSASNKWYDSWATTRGLSTRVDANNGSFTITNVPVAETNSLLVTVRDVSGNVASQTVSFTKTLTKTETFGYDLNGNLTNWVTGNLTNQYSYDQQDRLVKVTSNGTAVLECWYDAIGRRIAKREVRGGQTFDLYYVYDGWSPMAVLDKAGNVLEVYTRGSGIARDVGTLVAATYLPGAVSATGTYYLLDNLRGDVTAVRSGTTTIASFDYRPFGETRSSTGSIDLRFRFSSKELDQAVGLYRYDYRYLAPSMGRWIGQDPLMETAGLNLHTFARNNPVLFVDGDGRWLTPDTLIDIGSIGIDLYRLAADGPCNRGENLVSLGLDVLGLAIPFATGLGLQYRAARYADDVASLVRGQRVAENAARGRAFQAQVLQTLGTPHNTTAVAIQDLGTSIPDIMRNGDITEIKDVLNLSFTRQLQIQAEAAEGSFSLIVGPRTQSISAPLQNAVYSSGGTIQMFNPSTGAFTQWP